MNFFKPEKASDLPLLSQFWGDCELRSVVCASTNVPAFAKPNLDKHMFGGAVLKKLRHSGKAIQEGCDALVIATRVLSPEECCKDPEEARDVFEKESVEEKVARNCM